MADAAAVKDDIQLMRRIAERDPAALRALYDRHSGLVFAIGLKMLHNRDDADELVADVFFELWEKSSRYDQTRAAPVTYIVTLARSRCIDRLRRRGNRPSISIETVNLPAPATDISAADNSSLAEQAALVRKAVDLLDKSHREAIEAAYYLGLSHSEIAAKLNKPLGTIKTYIRQGLIQMRENMRRNDES